MRITINGPAAAGKGTIARAYARRYGMHYVDIGLLFRGISWCVEEDKSEDATAVIAKTSRILTYTWNGEMATVCHRGVDITSRLVEPALATVASRLAADPAFSPLLHRAVAEYLSRHSSVICDGRSAGTVLLPDAVVKCYATAELTVRAARRHADLMKAGYAFAFHEVLRQLRERDERDCNRPCDPLIVPKNAIMLDTGVLSVAQCVGCIHDIVTARSLNHG